MDNLEVLLYGTKSFDSDILGKPTVSSLFQDNCCLITTKGNICLYNALADELHTTVLDEDIQDVKYMKYMSLYNIIFMADDFNLITYDPQTYKFQIVHSCVRKITSLSWNPHETFLVVLNNENELYGYTFEGVLNKFTAVYKSKLDSAVPNSVYVGWGSHNTQFQGPKKEEQEIIEEITQAYADPTISWRGNGEQFVVNFWKDGRRYLKVFDNSLRPLYESGVYLNLQKPVSFKGQGNFIACAAVHNNENKIVIFEKNCLVKTEFSVPENKGNIQEILFHPELSVLGVYSISNDNVGSLNIYVNSNAKWFLKQQLYYPPDNLLKSFAWVNDHISTVCRIAVLTLRNVEFYTFRFIVNRSPNSSVVAVTDGTEVNFTFLDKQIIPPPMCGSRLTFDKPINRILFHPNLKQCLLLDSSLRVKLYGFNENVLHETSSTDLSSLCINQTNILSALDNCWSDELKQKLFSGDFLSPIDTTKFSTYQLLPYNDTTGILPTQTLEKTDNTNIIYCTAKIINNESYEFSLTATQQLLLNNTEVTNNVTSLFIYKEYLLFTHAGSKMYCVRLTTQNLNNYSWNLDQFYSRDIEQGARIICVNDKPLIIMQLPRGNLESVTCRLIAIDAVETLLSENKWDEAIYSVRHQKLNWNLLIDLNPVRFSDHIQEFIKAAKTVSILNTIVSEFSNENCLKTMYNQCLPDTALIDIDKKHILADILDCVNNIDPISNLISVVTIQIKHFTLKAALHSVCDAYEKGHMEICKKAINQILLYSHSKDVINETYTLYKIDFLRFVYGCCSEDPRIYEPEIEKLEELDSVELRFTMSVQGKHFETATKYLIRCPGYTERYISDFISKYSTYSVAYNSIHPKSQNFVLVTKLYANHLSMKGKHEEAAFILNRAGLMDECLEEYRLALNLYQVLHIINQLDLDDDRKIEIILSMADDFSNAKRIDEAVMLYEHYAGNHVKAVYVLLKHREYEKAICLARKYNRTDIIDDDIKPAIAEYRTSLYEKIVELGEKFVKYSRRLETVRVSNLEKLKARYMDSGHYDNPDDDLYSDYGSTISSRSSRSRGSTMSSRNRRKEEKKKIDLREGGFYEDIALLRQLYLIITDIFKCGKDVRDICLTLVDEKSYTYARLLHKKLNDIQETVKSCIPKIWTATFLQSAESSDPTVLAVIQNREDLELKYRNPPTIDIMDESWKLLFFS